MLAEHNDAFIGRVSRVTGQRVTGMETVRRGYTPALRRIVHLADGTSMFAKLATTDDTAHELRLEYAVYGGPGADFLPALRGWEDDGDQPLLLLEDLSDARWPPPWSDRDVQQVRHALAMVADSPVPDFLPRLGPADEGFVAWERIAADPDAFLSLRLCSASWLELALPGLIAAERSASLAGDALVHGDVYNDNICFVRGRAVLIDWGNARRGNPLFDLATFLVSARAEGAPVPETIIPGAPGIAALYTGMAAFTAALPPRTPDSDIRDLQINDLRRAALPWVVAALGLPPLDDPAITIDASRHP